MARILDAETRAKIREEKRLQAQADAHKQYEHEQTLIKQAEILAEKARYKSANAAKHRKYDNAE